MKAEEETRKGIEKAVNFIDLTIQNLTRLR